MIAAIFATTVLSCSPAISQAALNALWPTFEPTPSGLGVWLGDDDAASIKRYEAKIADYRLRVAKIKDPCSRQAYEHWLGFYAGNLADARRELTDHHIRNQQRAFEREMDARNAEARAAKIEGLP
jgi:hypothetical protein